MKRVLASILAATVLLSFFSACGSATESSAPSSEAATQATEAATQAPTEVFVPSDDGMQTLTTSYEDTTSEMDLTGITLKQAPSLDGADLPPVEERLPKVPKLTNELEADMLDYKIGEYGGTVRTATAIVDWDADAFVGLNEPLLNSPGIIGKQITGNILRGYEVSENQQEFTFYLREGLKWSDGVPVTMDDFRFAIEDILLNPEYTLSIAPWLRSGAEMDGTPLAFEEVDDWTFKIKFDQPYGGFLFRLSITNWVGYTDLLLPSHFLKRFHPDYATEAEKAEWPAICEKYGIASGVDDSGKDLTWRNIMTYHIVTTRQMTQKRAMEIGVPVLTPWVLKDVQDSVYVFERNPYYFKIDSEGNQLPYIDRIESTLVQDMETVTLKVLGGDVDLCREGASLFNLPTFKENEASGGYTTYMALQHNTPNDIGLNMTFSDDEGYRAMVQDVRFRKALSLAIDREEIIDSIYYGFAQPNSWQDSTYDPAAAEALLQDMGMVKGPDGFYLRPDGQPFSILIENGAEAPDLIPNCELYVDMWRAIGVNASLSRLSRTLVGNKNLANELQVRVIWTETPLWPYLNFGLGYWGRTWDMWRSNTSEITITDPDTGETTKQNVVGEEPPANVKEFYDLVDKLVQVDLAEANNVYGEIKQSLNDNFWYIVPLEGVRQPLVVNSKIQNVSDKAFAISANFSLEQMWFDKE